MRKNKFFVIVVNLFILGILAGCQNATPSDSKPTSADKSQEEAVDPNYAVPSSKGPESAPEVKGPATSPPASGNENGDSAPQAVTEKENIRLTLPIQSNQ